MAESGKSKWFHKLGPDLSSRHQIRSNKAKVTLVVALSKILLRRTV